MSRVSIEGQIVTALADMKLVAGDKVLVAEGMLIRKVTSQVKTTLTSVNRHTVATDVLKLIEEHGALTIQKMGDLLNLDRKDLEGRLILGEVARNMRDRGVLHCPPSNRTHTRLYAKKP